MNFTTKEQLEMVIQQFKELTAVYRNAISYTGISENEFWIWYTLIFSDAEYSQQDICSIWSLPKQTVNNIITHMVKKELAILEVIPGTRNQKIIRLTEQGRQYGTGIVTPVCNAEERAANRLDQEEFAVCINVIGKFIKLLKEEINNEESRELAKP